MAGSTYDEVLRAAVADLTENGYDSAERVAYWQARLREAAASYLKSTEQMEADLRAALAAEWRRLVEQGGVLKHHPGVSRYTLDRVAPQLRSVLDRRVAAASDLIRLNRQQMMARMEQRFAGWASSIPPGGVSEEGRRKKAAEIRKPLTSLSFEERRCFIDQAHKLSAAVSQTVAEGAGAIAGEWRSNWRQLNYNYRRDHKERDGHVYLLRGSWAVERGLVRPTPGVGYYDQVTAVGQEPFCRCQMRYIYHLRQLPEAMLTKKGREALAAARAAIGARTHAA